MDLTFTIFYILSGAVGFVIGWLIADLKEK